MFLLLGFLVEETPCEHGENMQTPHRRAREIAHCALWGGPAPQSQQRPMRESNHDLLAVRQQCKQCKQLSHRATCVMMVNMLVYMQVSNSDDAPMAGFSFQS